ALALAAGMAATGCLHEDGLSDVADGFGGGKTREHKLEIMRDSRIGTYGTAALGLSLLLRWSALAGLAGPVEVLAALIAAHCASRALLGAFMHLLPRARADGGSLTDVLDALARRDGLYLSAPVTVRVDDVSLIGDAMARLRSQPPSSLGGSPVTRVIDLADGLDVPDADGVNGGAYRVPPTDGMWFETLDATRVVVRPSGTEPKLKAYLDVLVPIADDEPVDGARWRARERLAAVAADVEAAIAI
ncbi:MAG: adenosylcobinamide-GDP ribazoletransferase, partial [Salana multivorans]|nr:adenosylcobinamide-GDP ribazoletransferase [Salana multivorans]